MLRKGFDLFPQKILSVKVKEKVPLEKLPSLQGAIRDLEKKYQGNGRVNVRYSGTETVLRLMIEGPEQKKIDADLNQLADVVRRELGA